MNNILKTILAFIASFFSFLFGSFDLLLKTLVTLIKIYYITGLCKSFIQKKLIEHL